MICSVVVSPARPKLAVLRDGTQRMRCGTEVVAIVVGRLLASKPEITKFGFPSLWTHSWT